MDYALASRDSGDIDWGHPVHVRCMICGAEHDITRVDVLQADAEMACRHCGATVPHPAAAARVQCTGCGVFLLGPDLSTQQREELRIAEGLRGLVLRERVRVAKERAALRREAGQ